MNDITDILATMQQRNTALTKANQLNKEIVFDALAAAGITRVTVEFDGYGDSGQIESVLAFAGEERRELPATSIMRHEASWNTAEISTIATPLSEAVEAICYDFLEQEHGGWENNDGAAGEFTFHVTERRIELDCNIRFTDSTHFSHAF